MRDVIYGWPHAPLTIPNQLLLFSNHDGYQYYIVMGLSKTILPSQKSASHENKQGHLLCTPLQNQVLDSQRRLNLQIYDEGIFES